LAIVTETIRPTKKQRELLTFIEQFIAEHGYSPSYREIMSGLEYTSVATVALHVNNLVRRGHLRKREHSARSLEVTAPVMEPGIPVNTVTPKEEKWLVQKVEYFLTEAESLGEMTESVLERLQVLIAALQVLGLEGAAHSFAPRVSALKKRLPESVRALDNT
jgi:repressor LexA